MVTSGINAFSPGISIAIVISAVTNAPGCDERNVKLEGKGLVVRSDVMDVTGCSGRLGVAL